MRKIVAFVLMAGLFVGLGTEGLWLSVSSQSESYAGLNNRKYLPVTVPGQTATQLSDGRWLKFGGPGALTALAALEDPRSGSFELLSDRPLVARAWHTATVLVDGRVFIFGGIGSDKVVARVQEIFDPETGRFERLHGLNLQPRAHHTATLLTDGRVLIAGGVSADGEALKHVELYDPQRNLSETILGELSSGRLNHRAALLADGGVLLWGGVDADGTAVGHLERFSAELESIVAETYSDVATGSGSAVLEVSLPGDGVSDVAVDEVLALRFSRPLLAESIGQASVALWGLRGTVAARIVSAESGMLVFVTPLQDLAEATTYTLSIAGAMDVEGYLVPAVEVSFTTEGTRPAGLPAPPMAGARTSSTDPSSATAGPVESALPKKLAARASDGIKATESSYTPRMAAPGVTAISGRVMTAAGQPLEDVRIYVGTKEVKTDSTGRFLMTNVSAGRAKLYLEANSAGQNGNKYGTYVLGVDVVAGITNVLPYTSWLTPIDEDNEVGLSSPTENEVVVTTPAIPGLEVRIPAGAVIRDYNGNVINKVSITQLPIDLPPFPLPDRVEVPVYFTLQPGGAYVEGPNGGIRIIYPNYNNERLSHLRASGTTIHQARIGMSTEKGLYPPTAARSCPIRA